jgi:hypothetical protein
MLPTNKFVTVVILIFNLFKTERGKRNLFLTLILLLSFVSGATTITGAQQILPEGIGFMAGFVVQSFLFILLAELHPKKFSSTAKLFLICILMIASIYGSFFAIYDKIGGEDNASKKSDYASQSHAKLYGEVFTPLKTKLDQLEHEVIDFTQQSGNEADGKGITGKVGRGEEYRKLFIANIERQKEISALKPLVNRLDKLFNTNLINLSPQKILEKDRSALKEIPFDRLPAKYKIDNPQSILKISDYVESGAEAKFFLPYHRIVEKDSSAFMSLLIAAGVDSILIALGEGIKKRTSKPFEHSALHLYSLIIGWFNFCATLIDARKTPGKPYGDVSLINELPDFISIKLKGKGSEFLDSFLDCVDPLTSQIDTNKLFSDIEESTFKTGFRILFHALKIRRWIVNNNQTNSFEIPAQSYADFLCWITTATVDQQEYEDSLQAITSFGNSLREIHINMPNILGVEPTT